MSTDPQVNHPTHYVSHPIISGECWTYAQALDNGAEFSAFKYFFRHGGKGKALQDTEKGIWYLNQMIDNPELQAVNHALETMDKMHDFTASDLAEVMTARRFKAMVQFNADIDLELYAGAREAAQLAVNVCKEILRGIDIAGALDMAERVRDLIANEDKMLNDNKVALRREALFSVDAKPDYIVVGGISPVEVKEAVADAVATPADLGMVYPPLTLKHGTVHRKSGATNILHTGRVQVVYRGDNPGNVVGHTPGGRGMRTRAAIDHLINVLDLAAGIKPGAGMTLHCHTGTRRNRPVFNYHDNVTNKDDPFTPVYNDVQAALWGIEHAMFLDWEDSKKQTDPYFRELHTYVISVN
ncbi:nucleotide kinase [Corynebacterium phage phi674]|uniref:Uncharacterized protein n=1 Tax=Corynebacterium phage phi674 TaxID=2052822 RepID=A0A2H4PIZ4_9CAUD|nr:nucleotide kinase [Corynebacterium phage phi674]ATW62952.1 hypothetical protein phi674_gp34 [Corynebacterium phage phi674]